MHCFGQLGRRVFDNRVGCPQSKKRITRAAAWCRCCPQIIRDATHVERILAICVGAVYNRIMILKMINSIFAIRKRREFILLAITLVFFWKIFAGQVLACTNECLNDGDKQCGGQITYNNNTYSTFQICSDSNLDGCLEWSGLTACNPGQSCSAGACVAAQQVCVPGALSVCKVCNAAGTAWADDSTKCPSGKVN